MNKKLRLILIITAAVIVLTVAAVFVVREVRANAPEPTPSPTPTPTATPDPTPTPTPEHVNTVSATIAVGGDILMHTGLNAEAKTADGYDYAPIFGVISQEIESADYAVCSMPTTFASGDNYTAYPRFKSPDSLASSIAQVGFNLVNTATSNCMDSNKDGLDYTLNVLDSAGLAHVGTYRTAEERNAASGITYADINGIKVAFLSYTKDTNRIPVAGFEYAVNICTTNYLTDADSIDYDVIAADMEEARDSEADAIFVFMSWGNEFETEPSELEQKLADYLIEQGADFIMGGHTRVPQPIERRTVTNEDGSERYAYICYSLGNLISCQNDEYTDISALLSLSFTKDSDTGYTWISDVSYVPIYMADLYDFGFEDMGWHYRLVNLHSAIESYDSGSPWAFVNEAVYGKMTQALDDLHSFLGEEYDSAYTAEEPVDSPAPSESPTPEESAPASPPASPAASPSASPTA